MGYYYYCSYCYYYDIDNIQVHVGPLWRHLSLVVVRTQHCILYYLVNKEGNWKWVTSSTLVTQGLEEQTWVVCGISLPVYSVYTRQICYQHDTRCRNLDCLDGPVKESNLFCRRGLWARICSLEKLTEFRQGLELWLENVDRTGKELLPVSAWCQRPQVHILHIHGMVASPPNLDRSTCPPVSFQLSQCKRSNLPNCVMY